VQRLSDACFSGTRDRRCLCMAVPAGHTGKVGYQWLLLALSRRLTLDVVRRQDLCLLSVAEGHTCRSMTKAKLIRERRPSVQAPSSNDFSGQTRALSAVVRRTHSATSVGAGNTRRGIPPRVSTPAGLHPRHRARPLTPIVAVVTVTRNGCVFSLPWWPDTFPRRAAGTGGSERVAPSLSLRFNGVLSASATRSFGIR